MALGWAGIAAALFAAGGMPDGSRRLFLAGLRQGVGLLEACRAAGVDVAQAIAARQGDPSFRQDWEDADRERLDAVETLLIDQLIQLLSRDGQPAEKAADKATLQLWQTLKDERRRSAPPTPRAAPSAPPAPAAEAPARPPTPVDEAAEADRIARLIADVERRMQAAEAEMGLS